MARQLAARSSRLRLVAGTLSIENHWKQITAVVGVTVLGMALLTSGSWFWMRAGDAESPQMAYALLVDDALAEDTNMSEVVAFDETSGDVITRLKAGEAPNVVVDPSGEKIFLLQTKRDSPESGADVLSVIDTQSWEETNSTTVTRRIQYTLTGPSALALSPDGTRLVVYSTNSLGDYWFEIFNAVTLERLGNITLPRGCGGTPLLTTRTEVAVLCGITKEGSDAEGMIDTPLALQFVDVSTGTVTAAALPDAGLYLKGKPVGMVVTDDGASIYVVFNDLRIMEIDAATHRVTRDVTTWVTDEPTVFGMALSNDGELLVGQASDVKSWTDMTLRRFALPTLEPLEPISVQQHPRMAAGPDSEIYQWERGSTKLRRLNLDDGSVLEIDLGGEKTLVADIVRAK